MYAKTGFGKIVILGEIVGHDLRPGHMFKCFLLFYIGKMTFCIVVQWSSVQCSIAQRSTVH